MRFPLLSLGLAGLLTLSFVQEEEIKRPLGFSGFKETEKERIEEEIEGTWMLLEYKSPREVLPRNQYAGFASFQNNFFSMTLRLSGTKRGIFADRPATVVQAGVHRYRLSNDLRLQTATVMGFSNENDDFELEIEPSAYPREYQVSLKEDQLSLRRADGLEFVFRRADSDGYFPRKAADALERNRGRVFRVPDDWEQRR